MKKKNRIIVVEKIESGKKVDEDFENMLKPKLKLTPKTEIETRNIIQPLKEIKEPIQKPTKPSPEKKVVDYRKKSKSK